MGYSGYRFTIHNNKYKAVLTGHLVRIYDKNSNKELTRFKDLKHTYRAAFHPMKNVLAVKSNLSWLAFYNLDTMTLIQKFKCKKADDNGQDPGFCFSADGSRLLNIESSFINVDEKNIYTTTLVVYDTETFEEITRYFEESQYRFKIIERHNDGYLLAGSDRNAVNVIVFFDGTEVTETHVIDDPDFLRKTSAYDEIHYQD